MNRGYAPRRNGPGRRLGRGLLRILIGLGVTALILIAVASWFWYRSVPRRTVIRNAQMTPARDVTALLELEAGEPFAVLADRAKSAAYLDYKWLKNVKLKYAYPQTAVITPVERKPLLAVSAADAAYWLCDDGILVRQSTGDEGGVFELIGLLPTVSLANDPGESAVNWTAGVCTAVACIQETMPGMISKIEVAADGNLTLIESRGLPIRLGEPEYLAEKIGALPKALRLCELNRSDLEYLDASNHKVFYENWKTVVE